MSVSIKGPYHDTDDRVFDAITRKIIIINEIINYMTVFKSNGTDLLQKLNTIIQEIHQIQPQSLTPSAVSILKWIIKHVGLAENISSFYNDSINELIQLFTNLSSDTNKKFQEMEADLSKEEKKYNTVFDEFETSSKAHVSIHETLCGIQAKIEKFTNENNTSKADKFKADFEKTQKEYLAAEKKSFEKQNAFFYSKLQMAAEEEHFIVKWEQLDREIYQIIQDLLQKYSEKVKQISEEMHELSQESHNSSLKELRDECINTPSNESMDNFNYEDSFKKLKKKYTYDETLPKIDFNIFKFLQPQEVFKDDLNCSYLMVKQNYTTKNLDEIEMKKGNILKLISFNDDGTLTVRNEETGEIGSISNQYVKAVDEDFKIVRQIRKIHNDNDDDPRYVLAMSEADPETHLIKCMDADGTVTWLNESMFDPPEQ